jgi:hypothetical protein
MLVELLPAAGSRAAGDLVLGGDGIALVDDPPLSRDELPARVEAPSPDRADPTAARYARPEGR